RLWVRIPSGGVPGLSCVIAVGRSRFNLELFYKRSFNRERVAPEGLYIHSQSSSGSWSKEMKPDLTLAISTMYGRHRALIHFDAKHRAEMDKDPATNDDATDSDIWRYKAEDLDKMHAYVNAIRSSVGAFGIYPGHRSVVFCENDTLLPGVGMIGVTP